MDGVTTNGILIMHLNNVDFSENSEGTRWREVSVGGYVFDLGEKRTKMTYQLAVNIFI